MLPVQLMVVVVVVVKWLQRLPGFLYVASLPVQKLAVAFPLCALVVVVAMCGWLWLAACPLPVVFLSSAHRVFEPLPFSLPLSFLASIDSLCFFLPLICFSACVGIPPGFFRTAL